MWIVHYDIIKFMVKAVNVAFALMLIAVCVCVCVFSMLHFCFYVKFKSIMHWEKTTLQAFNLQLLLVIIFFKIKMHLLIWYVPTLLEKQEVRKYLQLTVAGHNFSQFLVKVMLQRMLFLMKISCSLHVKNFPRGEETGNLKQCLMIFCVW